MGDFGFSRVLLNKHRFGAHRRSMPLTGRASRISFSENNAREDQVTHVLCQRCTSKVLLGRLRTPSNVPALCQTGLRGLFGMKRGPVVSRDM